MTGETAPVEPILPSWRISEVLKRYPQLLDVLVEVSPAFSRLRNPVLRRVQSRLVTVAQAAQIAGLEPAALVRILNDAIGATTPMAAAATVADRQEEPSVPGPQPSFEGAPVAVDLDVRPYQERGEEPFSAIMAAVSRVPVGQVLRLRNTFEPVPLYHVLGKQGFVHKTRQLGPDDWEVLFLRTGRTKQSGEQVSASERPSLPTQAWDRPTATVTVDVSDLVPPEPMVRILEALERLSPGETLLVHHVRRPVYLYARLDELGYAHETRELGPGQVEILIHKPGAG